MCKFLQNLKIHTTVEHFDIYSPTLKKWGYTGFALQVLPEFCGSVIPSFCHNSDET